MAAKGLRGRFRTSRHTWTAQKLKSGQTVFRRDGKFTSERAYRSAVSHSSAKGEGAFAINFPTGDAGPTEAGFPEVPIQRDIVDIDMRGRFVAGPDANQYDPTIREGQFLSKDQAKELRMIRGSERNFYAFWRTPGNRFLDRDDAVDKYVQMLDALKRIKDRASARTILDDFDFTSP